MVVLCGREIIKEDTEGGGKSVGGLLEIVCVSQGAFNNSLKAEKTLIGSYLYNSNSIQIFNETLRMLMITCRRLLTIIK